jgi:malic enzyme
MPPRSPLEEHARQSGRRLVDLIQTATVDYPQVIIALADVADAFLREERRRSVMERMRYVDDQGLAAVEAAIAQQERSRDEDAPPPIGA